MHFTFAETLTLITLVTTSICSIIAALKTTTTGRKVAQHTEHLTKQDETLNTIETQTNGNATRMAEELKAANQKIAELTAQAGELTAQARAKDVMRASVAEVRRQIASGGGFVERRQKKAEKEPK